MRDWWSCNCSINAAAGERKLLRFQPAMSILHESVLEITAYLDADEITTKPMLLFEFWDPYSATWTSLEPNWQDTRVPHPGDYVFPEGGEYLAVRNLSSLPFGLENLSLVMVVETQDGDLIRFGTE